MLKNYKFISQSQIRNLNPSKLNIGNLFRFQIYNFRMKSTLTSSRNNIHTTKVKSLQNSEKINDKEKEINYYYTKAELALINGKFSVIKTTKSKTVIFSKIIRILITSICTISVTTGIWSLYLKSYMITSISSVITLIAFYFRSIIYKNLSRLTIEINLLEDGKNVEIVTFSKRFVVDIKSIKVPNKFQNLALNKLNPDTANRNTPFVIDNGPHKGFYYIPPEKEIQQSHDLLYAILNKDKIFFEDNPK